MLPRSEVVRQINDLYNTNAKLKHYLNECHPRHENPEVCNACLALERHVPQVEEFAGIQGLATERRYVDKIPDAARERNLTSDIKRGF